jgi:hypothetical protein
MPLDDAAVSELKSLIAFSRRGPVNFGLCLGGKPEDTALVLHRLRSPEVLMREAKKAGGTPKVTCGTVETAGKIIRLSCLEDPPPGCAKRLRLFLRNIVKLNFKVTVANAAGDILEEDADPDDLDEAAAEPDADTGAVPEGVVAKRKFLIERWRQIPGELDVHLQRLKTDIAAKLPHEDPEDFGEGVRLTLKRLTDAVEADLNDAIDASINAGDAKYAAVADALGRLRKRVSEDAMVSFLRRTSLFPGRPVEAALLKAFDEIDAALTT